MFSKLCAKSLSCVAKKGNSALQCKFQAIGTSFENAGRGTGKNLSTLAGLVFSSCDRISFVSPDSDFISLYSQRECEYTPIYRDEVHSELKKISFSTPESDYCAMDLAVAGR